MRECAAYLDWFLESPIGDHTCYLNDCVLLQVKTCKLCRILCIPPASKIQLRYSNEGVMPVISRSTQTNGCLCVIFGFFPTALGPLRSCSMLQGQEQPLYVETLTTYSSECMCRWGVLAWHPSELQIGWSRWPCLQPLPCLKYLCCQERSPLPVQQSGWLPCKPDSSHRRPSLRECDF